MTRKKQPLQRDAIVEEARKRFDYAVEVWTPIYDRCTDDMRFSDPTDPQQWPEDVKRERKNAPGGARPCLVFDQTQQHVRQVINTARRNKPAMTFLPVDDSSDPELAEVLQGLARQTEYDSRAVVAYITGLNHATRGGIGYFRLVLETVKGHSVKDQRCAKIKRVVDFRSVWPDPEFVEPDGSDMGWCFVEDQMLRDDFVKKYPNARIDQTDTRGWFSKDHVRILECYRLIETDGKTVCEHFKMSGEEILVDADGEQEKSVFPGEFVPVFPVLGNEEWDEGKRRLSGCIRLARDAQITYNFERNSEFEAVAIGPKVPWAGPADAFAPYEQHWKQANSGNMAYLPYATTDENGQPIPFKPERVAPAGIASGWTQLSERSKQDIQAALGGFESGVGNNPNDQSGRAVLALQDRQDVGTYHYVDNLALSIAHCGRVLTQVWPVIYDQAQVLRIIGEDDEPSFVSVDPNQKQGYVQKKTLEGDKQIVINPGVGKYDVRAVVGPAFQTRQAETAAELGEFINGNPQMLSLLGDVLVKARNYPDAGKLAKRFQLMLPPQIQQAEQAEDGEQQIPPQIMQVMQQAQQEIQGLQQQLQEAQSGMAVEQFKAQQQGMLAQFEAQQTAQIEQEREATKRYIAELNADNKHDIAELTGMVQLLLQKMQPPPQLAAAVSEDMAEDQS